MILMRVLFVYNYYKELLLLDQDLIYTLHTYRDVYVYNYYKGIVTFGLKLAIHPPYITHRDMLHGSVSIFKMS